MLTQIEAARRGKISPEVRQVAKSEGLAAEQLRKAVASGTVIIPVNSNRRGRIRVCGIGSGLKTKINANIGTSRGSSSIAYELKKLSAAVKLGSDTIMDLSTGSRIRETRREILRYSSVPVGTVPVYEIVINGLKRYGSVRDIGEGDILECLEAQAKEGVDFFTVHAGLLKDALDVLSENRRVLDIVSRGGAFIAEWMISNNSQNPFYTRFDEILDIAKRYDVTLSLGDGLRPGSVADATDAPQVMELVALGQLQKRCLKAGVQSMIEGPGHVPINEIETNVMLEKALCNGAPFYVLGPLVTDIAPGYDHITSAIGAAIAAARGADFLCYVTPSEHIRLPSIEDVKEGVVASKIAAHAGDIAKNVKGAMDLDVAMSKARARRDWKEQFRLAIDGEKPSGYRASSRPAKEDICTMCGDYCSIKTAEKCFRS